AGKTTLLECAVGLRRPTRGRVRLLGVDPWRQRELARARVGVQLQAAELPEMLKVREALELYASFYPHPADWRPLAERMGLAEKMDARFGKLSGGQRQRLFIALALVGNPAIVFLDELTAGLDPQARRSMWQLVTD